mmetsp:Transcript_73484/g.207540  ORF Transcript_73484/g.207540 Transcript_73484/m.207540 type:complete len:344 (+) Transcript_73484:807-1838(+)
MSVADTRDRYLGCRSNRSTRNSRIWPFCSSRSRNSSSSLLLLFTVRTTARRKVSKASIASSPSAALKSRASICVRPCSRSSSMSVVSVLGFSELGPAEDTVRPLARIGSETAGDADAAAACMAFRICARLGGAGAASSGVPAAPAGAHGYAELPVAGAGGGLWPEWVPANVVAGPEAIGGVTASSSGLSSASSSFSSSSSCSLSASRAAMSSGRPARRRALLCRACSQVPTCSSCVRTASICFRNSFFCVRSSTRNFSTASFGSRSPSKASGGASRPLEAWMTPRRKALNAVTPVSHWPGATFVIWSMLSVKSLRVAAAFSPCRAAIPSGRIAIRPSEGLRCE